jgi:hypothetical protein
VKALGDLVEGDVDMKTSRFAMNPASDNTARIAREREGADSAAEVGN